LDRWCSRAQRSRIPEFVKTAATIRKNKAGITAAIERQLSNGRHEGLNNKIRTMTRRAYGSHSPEAALALIMLTCGPTTLTLPYLLTAASDDHEGVTFGDDVKSPRVHVRAGLGVVMVSRSSSCCRGLTGTAAAPLGAGQPLRTGARSWPRAINAMICHGGAVGPSLRTEAAAA